MVSKIRWWARSRYMLKKKRKYINLETIITVNDRLLEKTAYLSLNKRYKNTRFIADFLATTRNICTLDECTASDFLCDIYRRGSEKLSEHAQFDVLLNHLPSSYLPTSFLPQRHDYMGTADCGTHKKNLNFCLKSLQDINWWNWLLWTEISIEIRSVYRILEL